MVKGITFALCACLVWASIFVIPQWMDGFSALEIALGRYLCYGLISLLIFIKDRMRGLCRYPFFIWMKAFGFSIASCVGYYTCVVLALRYATPAVCALILGMGPVTIAFYGSWQIPAYNYRCLILPSLFIILGLILINGSNLFMSSSIAEYCFGLACGCTALISWTWFAVDNARFLKQYPEISPGNWSTLMGVANLWCVLLFGILIVGFGQNMIDFNKYFEWNSAIINFIIGSTILGVWCSWVGSFLWNHASVHLPVSLAGQLTIFETIFGLTLVYLLEQKIPPLIECLGIALLLVAIGYAIKATSIEPSLEVTNR